MGIYIPGIDMPDSCDNCFICNRCEGNCDISDADYLPTKRPDDCPLIELPPHGRLIDADALMDGWMNLREATKYGNETKEQVNHSYSTMMMYEIADVIEGAPTIIPAEEG